MDETLLLDYINTIISFLDKSLKKDKISNFKLEDIGDSINFIYQTFQEELPILKIESFDEETLKNIYIAIASIYSDKLEIGAISTYNEKGKEHKFHLAPVIDEKIMIVISSEKDYDQEWLNNEICNETIHKGLH